METNIELWDELYQQGKNYLHYPDESFLKLFYSVVGHKNKSQLTRALDFGAGSGAVTEFLCQRFKNVFACDSSAAARNLLRERLPENATISDCARLSQQPPRSFDLIVAWHVLYYLDESSVAAVLSAFAKLLKPDGVLLATVLHDSDVFYLQSRSGLGRSRTLDFADQKNAQILFWSPDELAGLFSAYELEIGESTYKFGDRVNHYRLLAARPKHNLSGDSK